MIPGGHPDIPSAKIGVLLGFTVVPAIVVASALIGLRGYDLDEQRLTERLTEEVS